MEQLTALAGEIREQIIRVVQANGGHLASNLGVTELTIALHYVFDFSNDRICFDVGHQCYAHKILTGRGSRFETLRQAGGISGFPSPTESEYDLFYTGHAGTAVSTATGLAWADKELKQDRKAVAVVGDASIVNGLSLEGLNNASMLKRQFLIVLNDNSMAIDRTRGGLAEALDRVRMDTRYVDLKTHTEQLLHRLPLGDGISDALKHLKEGLRTTLHGPKVFETLGFGYFGPVNGHDLPTLIRVLQRVSKLNHPVVLHVHTEKGRGCPYAVEDPCRFHSPSAFTVRNEEPVFAESRRPTWTKVFARTLIDKARADSRIVATTAAMPDGTGLALFREEFPGRTIDVGISESHAVAAAAAGMAKAGLKPVVAVYSTFLQRAFDQIYHDCALQRLPVIFCMDRAGLVGSDGAVHHGLLDIATLRGLPGVTLLAPADEEELSAALDFALACDGPVALRYPRDEVPAPLPGICPPFRAGQSRTVREGDDATILAYGAMVEPATAAADLLAGEDLSVAVVNLRFAKPIDALAVSRALQKGPTVVVEDHARIGGIGTAVLEEACQRGLDTRRLRRLGVADEFLEHATRQHQLAEAGLTAPQIAAALRELLQHAPTEDR